MKLLKVLALGASVLSVVSCADNTADKNNGDAVFDAALLGSYSEEQMDEFYTNGVLEADLRRCERAISGELTVNPEIQSGWCLIAASEGLSYSYLPVAISYEYGVGQQKSHEEAVKWYELAAENNQTEAFSALSRLYSGGEDGVVNYELARKYSLKALQAGIPSGGVTLASLSYNGLGGDRSLLECYAYAQIGLVLYDAKHEYQEDVYDEKRTSYTFLQDLCQKEMSEKEMSEAVELVKSLEQKYIP